MLVSLPPCGLFVAFAGTKHCCLTAINRCGALCCPDFPRDRGLKQVFFFPYPAIDRHTIYILLSSVVHATSAFRRRAAYGNRTRLLGLGSRCTTDVLMPQFRCKVTTFFSYIQKKRKNTYFSSLYLRLIFGLSSAETCARERVCVYRYVRLTENAYICDLRRFCIFFDIPPKLEKCKK